MEEDDLKALRSAALASRSAKLESGNVPGDEDLDALRKAALMTRKQNQIQVIQRKNETPQMPAAPIRLPMHLLPPMKNIPPPPLLVPPPPLHSLAMPPIFSRPLIVRPPVSAWATNNLISLTPGYRPIAASRHHHPFPRTSMLPLISVRAPFRGQSRKIPQRHTVPIKTNPVKAASLKVINPTESVEQKVMDKFSRYESKSSSEDEDETSAAKKKDDVSDAESVASEKSLSGESDVDNEADTGNAALEEKRPGDVPDAKFDDTPNAGPRGETHEERCDDDISIIGDGEDDDILAAIDDFLEDRPEKVEPNAAAKDSVARETPVAKKETAALKTEAAKAKKTPITFDMSESKTRSEDRRTSRDQSVLKSSDANFRANVKKRDIPSKIRNNVTVTTDNVAKESKRQCDRQAPRTGLSSRLQALSRDVGSERSWRIPVAANLKAPSPLRQRKDSDLDSVGTSDLSFLSSDEKTKEPEQTKPQRKRPRTRSISDEMEKRRNERLGKKSRLLDVKTERLPCTQSPAEDRRGHDLRKKLEDKGLKRPKAETAAPVANSDRDAKRRPDEIDIKRGIISLKARESRFGAAKSRHAGDDARIRITASVNAGTRAVRRTSNGSRAKDAASSESTPRRDRFAEGKRSFKPSPVVPPASAARTGKQPSKKTARRGSDERVLLRKSVEDRGPGNPDAVFEKESSDSSSEGEIFHEEQVFSFAEQDVADYDDVLGDITEEVELTPKVRRRSSGRGIGIGKGIKSRLPVEDKAAKIRTDSVRAEEPGKHKPKSKGQKKIPVHQRLGKQLQDTEESSQRRKCHSPDDDNDVYTVQRTEPEGRVHSGLKRRILVTKTPSPPPRADEFESKERKFQSRHDSSVQIKPKVKSVASAASRSKSRRVTKVRRPSKNHQRSPDRETVLERKIRRIKQQNGKILRRQMEIQKEKEEFG